MDAAMTQAPALTLPEEPEAPPPAAAPLAAWAAVPAHAPAQGPHTSVELSFSADSAKLYSAWQAMANLAKMAGQVFVTVKAQKAEVFGVLPLREADLIQ